MIHARSVIDFARAATSELIRHATGGHRLTDTTRPSCAIPGRPHHADAGMLICERHLQDLSRLLRAIEDETLQLSIAPSLAVTYDSGPGTSAPAFQRSPIRSEVAALADPRRGTGVVRGRDFDETGWDDTQSVVETLHAWARVVRAERRLTAPTATVVLHRWTATLTGPVCWHPPLTPCRHQSCAAAGTTIDAAVTDTVAATPTVTGERDLLTRHLAWIARQPWVEDFHAQLTELHTQLQRANNTLETHVGSCGTLLPTGAMCDGKVWHIVIKPDGKIARGHNHVGPDDQPGFRCASCRRVWTGTDAVRKRNDLWLEEQASRTSERIAK